MRLRKQFICFLNVLGTYAAEHCGWGGIRKYQHKLRTNQARRRHPRAWKTHRTLTAVGFGFFASSCYTSNLLWLSGESSRCHFTEWMALKSSYFSVGSSFAHCLFSQLSMHVALKGGGNSNLRLCEQELNLNCSNKAKSSLPQANHETLLNRSHKWQAASMKSIPLQRSGQSA